MKWVSSAKAPLRVIMILALLTLLGLGGWFPVWGNIQTSTWLWAKSAGGTGIDSGWGIAVDGSGNGYVTGAFKSPTITFGSTTLLNANPGSQDVFVVKYDSSGNALWAKSAGGTRQDSGTAIAVDGSGNGYLTGHFGSPTITFGSTTLTNAGSGDNVFVVKYDSNGNALWAKSAGSTGSGLGWGIAVDESGNAYVIGSSYDLTITFGSTTLLNANPGSSNVFVVKYDSNGSVLWAKNAGSSGSNLGWGIAAGGSGNVYVTGEFVGSTITFGSTTLTNVNPGKNDIFVVKYDSRGNVLWAKRAGSIGSGDEEHIAVDGNGNAYVIGDFDSPTISFGSTTLANANPGSRDVFVVKYDSSGNVLWAKRAGGTRDDLGVDIAVDASGNAYVIGDLVGSTISFASTTLTNANPGSSDVFVVKFDSGGNVLWAMSAGGTGVDGSSGIAVDGNSNAYVTGAFASPTITFGSTALINVNPGTQDVFVAKLK